MTFDALSNGIQGTNKILITYSSPGTQAVKRVPSFALRDVRTGSDDVIRRSGKSAKASYDTLVSALKNC
jgi:hypothetical protein